MVRVLCYVAHAQGHSRTYHIDMPADGKGAKGGDVMTKTHAVGAGASYGMRYLLKMIFNVAVGEDDADGNDLQAAHLGPEFDGWRARIDECNTAEDFAAAWKEMSPAVRAVMEPYAKACKAEKVK